MAESYAEQDQKLIDRLGYLEGMTVKAKSAYLDAQINEMNAIIYRNRVDTLILNNIEAVTSDIEDEQSIKVKAKEREIKQMAQAIEIMEKLRGEIA